jgi:hypothetical protein
VSAFIVITKDDSVELLSTTAGFNRDGIVRVVDWQQLVWPHYAVVVCGRGDSVLPAVILRTVMRYTRDLDVIADALRKEAGNLIFESGPVAFYFTTFAHSGFDAWHWHEIPPGDFYCGPDAVYNAYAAIIPKASEFDADAQAVPVFAAIRRKQTYARTTPHDGFHGYGVGGSLERPRGLHGPRQRTGNRPNNAVVCRRQAGCWHGARLQSGDAKHTQHRQPRRHREHAADHHLDRRLAAGRLGVEPMDRFVGGPDFVRNIR